MNSVGYIVTIVLVLSYLIGSAICLYRVHVDRKIKNDSFYEIWVNGGVWGKTGVVFLLLSTTLPLALLVFGGVFVTLVMLAVWGLIELVELVIGYVLYRRYR